MPGRMSTEAVDALRDLNFAADSFRAEVAKHYGLGVRETEAVTHLHARGGLSAGELGQLLHLTPGAVTNLLERLQREGLATREDDPGDARRAIVRPTQRSAEMLAEARGWLAYCLVGVEDLSAAAELLNLLSGRLRAIRDDLRAGRPVQPPAQHEAPVLESH